MTEINKGDEIRVERTGVVRSVSPSVLIEGNRTVAFEGRAGAISVRPDDTVEIIRRAGPEYEVGKVYRNRNGNFYVRTSTGRWRGLLTGLLVEHEHQSLPMTKMKLVKDA